MCASYGCFFGCCWLGGCVRMAAYGPSRNGHNRHRAQEQPDSRTTGTDTTAARDTTGTDTTGTGHNHRLPWWLAWWDKRKIRYVMAWLGRWDLDFDTCHTAYQSHRFLDWPKTLKRYATSALPVVNTGLLKAITNASSRRSLPENFRYHLVLLFWES